MTAGGSPQDTHIPAGEDPSLSPDGTKVVITRGISEGRGEAVIVDLKSGGQTVLTTADDPQVAAWSPAGDEIAFSAGSGGIRLIHPDGTGLEEVTHPVSTCVD